MRHYTKYQLSKLNNHVPRMRKCVVCKHLFDTQSYVFKPTAIYPIIRKTCSKSCTAKNMGYKNRRFNKTCMKIPDHNIVERPSAFWSHAIAEVRSWRLVEEQDVTDPPLLF